MPFLTPFFKNKIAQSGVKIYIMVWNETKLAMNLNSERVKSVLEALDKNITVICHPILLMKWSHHQKTVVCFFLIFIMVIITLINNFLGCGPRLSIPWRTGLMFWSLR